MTWVRKVLFYFLCVVIMVEEVIKSKSLSNFLNVIQQCEDKNNLTDKYLEIKALADYMMGDDYQKKPLKERIKWYMQVLNIIGPNYKTVLEDSATKVAIDKKEEFDDQLLNLTIEVNHLTTDLQKFQDNLIKAKQEANKNTEKNNEAIKEIDEKIEEEKKKMYVHFGVINKENFYFNDETYIGYNGIVGLIDGYEQGDSKGIITKLVWLNNAEEVQEELLITTKKDGVAIAAELNSFFDKMDSLFEEKKSTPGMKGW